jgi:hypothetical protein
MHGFSGAIKILRNYGVTTQCKDGGIHQMHHFDFGTFIARSG